MTFTLGVDIGTFESKGVIVDDRGSVLAQSATPHEMIVPRPGWAEHRPREDWWHDFCKITRDLLVRSEIAPDDIGCVATSAIGPCMLPVDDTGEPLMNAVLYGVDTRATAEICDLAQQIGASRILETCGNALTSQSIGPKILWLRRNRPEVFSKARSFLTSTSYLNYRLTGNHVIDHYTAANFSPLYDVNERCWTTRLADHVCDVEQLPDLRWSTEVAGTITEEAAAETGLAPGTPVTAGTIDAAAEAVSVGIRRSGDMMLMYGSTVFIVQLTEKRVQDERLWYAPWLYPGVHSSLAGLATSGTLTRWFGSQLARELDTDSSFEMLAAEARGSPPGARGLLLLPYFSGERTPIHDPDAKGAFFGLNLTHTRADMYRALLEGIANGTAHVFETFREVDAAPVRVRAVGGGTRNPIWLQSTSDIGRVTQEICATTVGASYGDAFLAACAIGAASPEDIDDWNPVVETVHPEIHEAHARQYRLFKQLYSRTRDIAALLGN